MRIKENLMNEFFDDIELGDTKGDKLIDENSKDEISTLKENAKNGDINAQIKLGRYYHHKNHYKLALVYYGLAAEKNAMEAVRLMADLYAKSRNFDKAIQCYEKLESIDGKSRNLEIGKALLKKGEESRALEYIKKSAECGNKDAVRILETLDYTPDIKLLEEKALLRKDRDAALALAEYHYDSDCQLSAFWYHFAYTHNYVYPLVNEQIKAIFGTVACSNGGLERTENVYAGHDFIVKNRKCRLRMEIDELVKDLNVNKDFSLLEELGDKYESLGEHAHAIQSYFMAIDEGSKGAYVKVAEVYMRTGDLHNGMYWLQKSARHNDVSAYRYLACIYKEMNDRESLLECYLKLLDLGDMSVCIDMARIYEERLDLPEAIYYYKKCITVISQVSAGTCFFSTGAKLEDLQVKVLRLEELYSLSPDYVERLEKIFKTYKKNACMAAIKLGNAFYEGLVTEKDYRKSAYWYKQTMIL